MSGRAYYNEIDKQAAAWLRELIKVGELPDGEVDERDIRDVVPGDLKGFVQCHFFAGIGGWAYALRLAGWPDDREVWTGSCPCQPFSAAGRGKGFADERHLWPSWHWLIDQCRPPVIFGEQVASKAGREWLDALVRPDLEALAYAVGAADLCAPGVGAPHIRQRLWFVAYAHEGRGGRHAGAVLGAQGSLAGEMRRLAHSTESGGETGELAHDIRVGRERGENPGRPAGEGAAERGQGVPDVERGGVPGDVADPQRHGRGQRCALAPGRNEGVGSQGARRRSEYAGGCGVLADADGGESRPAGVEVGWRGEAGELGHAASSGRPRERDQPAHSLPGQAGPWADAEWILCRDGKYRPAQPGIFPLVDGVSGGRVALGRAVQSPAATLSPEEAAHEFSRTGVLRGAGNAIVPQLAAAFIEAAEGAHE